MAFSNKKKQKLFTEINITPLTDIFLVLLIIMMVIAPSFKSMDQAVEVPKVNNGATIEDAKVTVSITKDGQMYVNDEGTTSSQLTDKLLAAKGTNENAEVVVVCAQIEAEIAELDTEEEKKEFLETLGLEQSGLDKLIKSSYALLGLISYLTAGPQEVRAWTIKVGTKAPAAGGKIHSDIERGFIRAETIAFNDLVQVGTMTAAKEKGLVRLEGKEYVVKDGDVILFRFNV